MSKPVPASRSKASRYLRAIGLRLLGGVPVFVLVTFAATALSDFLPGSAALSILGGQATPEQVAALNAQYGYDKPDWQRYAGWVERLFHGDLGTTLYSQQPIAGLLIGRAAATFEIAGLAMLVALLIAIPLAMFTAVRAGGAVDATLRVVSSAMLAVPIFVTVVILSFIFAIYLRLLPASGWVPFFHDPLGNLRYVVLPVMCLAVHQTAYFYGIGRAAFATTLQEDFVLVARARGLSTRYILMRHVLRPSLPPLLTVIGLSATYLLGGSFIVESYFSVPGIGWTMLSAVSSHDVPLMQAIISLIVVVFVLVFIMVDLGYAVIDPQVEVS